MHGFTGTVVGIKCADGVVLASDTRGTGYYLVLSKSLKKVFRIDERIGAAIAGNSGDIQTLIGLLRAEANLYRINHGRAISTKSIAKIASNILHDYRIFPYLADGILGGLDDDGPRLYFIDPVGGKLDENKFASAGSGSTIAYGVLEQQYRGNIRVEEGVKLAESAIKTAIERDAATGDRVVVAVIDKKGYREIENAGQKN
ncbi:MAG: proteasome subunit beta [Candidatus Hadarchaeales archaeon]